MYIAFDELYKIPTTTNNRYIFKNFDSSQYNKCLTLKNKT